jgi:uncharacterized protein DUF6714
MSAAAQIRNAFTSSNPPTAELFEGDSEGADEVFRGRRWNEISLTQLDYHSSALRQFTPEAFAYYLPAFMLAALANESLGLSDAVIDALSPPKNEPGRPSFQRRWSKLTSPQRGAAIAYLRHFEHRNPVAIQALVSSLEAHAG